MNKVKLGGFYKPMVHYNENGKDRLLYFMHGTNRWNKFLDKDVSYFRKKI